MASTQLTRRIYNVRSATASNKIAKNATKCTGKTRSRDIRYATPRLRQNCTTNIICNRDRARSRPVQWRRLHTTEHGGTCPPPTFTNGWARGQWRSQRRCGGRYRPLWPHNLFLVSRFSRIKRIVHYAVHLRQMNEWRRCRYIVSPFSKLPDPPLTGEGGTVSRRTANNKLIKPYWPPWKRSPKRLIVLVEPKKWRGTTTEIFFRPDVCPPHYFKIRSGATGAVAWNKLAPESRRGFATEIPTVFKKRLKRPHLDRRFKYSDHVS